MKSAPELHAEYKEIVCSLPGLDSAGQLVAARAMASSTAIYHGEVINFAYLPKLYPPSVIEQFSDIVSTLYDILAKVITRYKADSHYRALFGFDERLEELILLDPGYESPIPIMRADIFYQANSGAFKFCELNTDGASAMNEDRELCAALAKTPAFQLMLKRGYELQPFELFDSWVEAFLKTYQDWSLRRGSHDALPRAAIVDFQEEATTAEQEEFARRFRARGVDCEVIDIRTLQWNGQQLRTTDGQPVDALYRRAVTTDIMAHYDEVPDFLAAARAGAVCLVGGFQTQVAHAKIIFEVLHRPETHALLTPEEAAFVADHVPATWRLQNDTVDLNDVLASKDRWIIKPLDLYAARGVVAGRGVSQAEWEQTIREKIDTGYIIQEYVEQYRATNIRNVYSLPIGGQPQQLCEPQLEPFQDLTGLYMYNGDLAGVYSRAGQEALIFGHAGGLTLASFQVVGHH
ncbi:MAG: circularly permuted type 2 ATP-grasp protein [Coriobacteriia bacterium]|nr:circularly permuted type 2 ATP-grasp protein [Coriobacteriia bacterium]